MRVPCCRCHKWVRLDAVYSSMMICDQCRTSNDGHVETVINKRIKYRRRKEAKPHAV